MAGEVIVDALPYIDQGYDDPGVKDAVSCSKSQKNLHDFLSCIITIHNRIFLDYA